MKDIKDSINDICYDLDYGVNCELDDDSKLLIAKTLQKLPLNIKDKIFSDKVNFLAINEKDILHGRFQFIYFNNVIDKKEFTKFKNKDGFYYKEYKIPFIFLDFSRMKKMDDFTKMSIIAHEIAHFILKHDISKESIKDNILIFEKQADDLIEKWGFKRGYKEYNIKRVNKK